MIPFLIPSLVSMIAGAAVQAHAVQQARARQQHALREAMQRQRQFQQQAEQTVMRQAQDFDPQQRQQRQQAIAQRLEQALRPEPAPAPPGQGEAPAEQGRVSHDYLDARAQAHTQVQRDAQRLAHLLGQTAAAQRLRQREGWAMGDTGLALNQLSRHAQGIQMADNVGVEQAGTPSIWQQLLGGVLQSAGSVGLMKGLGSAGAAGATAFSPYQLPAVLGGLSGSMNISPWWNSGNRLSPWGFKGVD